MQVRFNFLVPSNSITVPWEERFVPTLFELVQILFLVPSNSITVSGEERFVPTLVDLGQIIFLVRSNSISRYLEVRLREAAVSGGVLSSLPWFYLHCS